VVELPGFHRRIVYGIVAIDNPGDTVVYDAEGTELQRIHHTQCRCDVCSAGLPRGTPAAAISIWQGDTPMRAWEGECLIEAQLPELTDF
jgi:hypothetical protein